MQLPGLIKTLILILATNLPGFFAQAQTPPSGTVPMISWDRCFEDIIQSNRRSGGSGLDLQYLIEDCLDLALGSSTRTSRDWQSSMRHQFAALPPSSPIRQTVSERAALIYYNDDLYCNNNSSTGGTFGVPNQTQTSCNNVFRVLSQLHPSGNYQYICHNVNDPSHCSDRWPSIASQLTVCDEDNAHKSYCHRLVRGFLNRAEECSAASTNDQCSTYVASRMTQDPCSFDNLDIDQCVPANAVGGASAPAVAGTPGDGGDPPDDTTANDPPGLTDGDQQDLIDAANNVAADTFAGGGQFNPANLRGQTNIPQVTIDGPNGGNINAAGFQGGIGMDPGRSTALPGIARLAPPTGGRPGGTPKQGGNAGGAGGGAVGGGGIAGAGGLGANAGGGGGAAAGRRRGGGGSAYSSVAKDMVSGFMGTDGPKTSGAPNARAASAVDQQVQKAIEDNRRNNFDRNALQNALDKNLNSPRGRQELVLRSSYFPDHSEVYLWLHQRSDLLNENGQ